MTLRQFELFVAVLEHGSIRRAAEALWIAQPSISAQLSRLEREVGGPLLIRHARGVLPTPAGRVLLKEAQTTLAAADRARRFAAQAIKGESGDIIFATVLSIAAGILPSALTAWHQKRPHARTYMHEHRSSAELMRATRQDLHDFAIGPEPTGDFEYRIPLGVEEFFIVLPESDPMMQRSSVDISQLGDRKWVGFSADHGLSQTMERIFTDAGIMPELAVSTSQTDVAARLAVAGLGPTIVPGNLVGPAHKHCARPLNPAMTRDLYAYATTPFSDLALGLIDEIRTVLQHG